MIKIPDNVLKFSDNVDLFDAWVDCFNHYRAVNYGAKVDYDKTVRFDEKEKLMNKAMQKEVNKICGFSSETVLSDRVWATNPMYQWAGFSIVSLLVDMVIPDVVADAYSQFSEVKTVDYGQSAVFDVESSDLFLVSKNGNNRRHITAQRQFASQTALLPENRSVTVQTDLYRLLCGKESLSRYAMKVALSIEAEIAKDVYSALSSSYSSLTANFKEAGFTQLAFQELRARVASANGGGKVSVFGTDIALSSILPVSDYMKMELGETYNNIGYLPVFLNTSLIALPQKINWASEDYDFAIANDELFFINSNSQSLVKVVFEGQTISIQDSAFSNANLQMDNTLHKRWVVGIVTNSKYGIMKI